MKSLPYQFQLMQRALEFSSIGFATQTLNIGSSTTVNASLATDASDLSEVVVTGYGTISKKDNAYLQ